MPVDTHSNFDNIQICKTEVISPFYDIEQHAKNGFLLPSPQHAIRRASLD